MSLDIKSLEASSICICAADPAVASDGALPLQPTAERTCSCTKQGPEALHLGIDYPSIISQPSSLVKHRFWMLTALLAPRLDLSTASKLVEK